MRFRLEQEDNRSFFLNDFHIFDLLCKWDFADAKNNIVGPKQGKKMSFGPSIPHRHAMSVAA